MGLMFGEVLEKVKRKKNIQEKVDIIRSNRTPAMVEVVKLFLIDQNDFHIENPSEIEYETAYYDPSRMTHIYPELPMFKRIFVERSDISQEKLKNLLYNLLKNIPVFEAEFLVEAMDTGKSSILTSDLLELAFPEFFEVPDASIPVSL